MDNTNPGRSPTPQRVEASEPTPPVEQPLMSFYDALKLVMAGKRVTRISWDNNEIYAFIKNETLMLHGGATGDGQDHLFTVVEGDIIATDWKVI